MEELRKGRAVERVGKHASGGRLCEAEPFASIVMRAVKEAGIDGIASAEEVEGVGELQFSASVGVDGLNCGEDRGLEDVASEDAVERGRRFGARFFDEGLDGESLWTVSGIF